MLVLLPDTQLTPDYAVFLGVTSTIIYIEKLVSPLLFNYRDIWSYSFTIYPAHLTIVCDRLIKSDILSQKKNTFIMWSVFPCFVIYYNQYQCYYTIEVESAIVEEDCVCDQLKIYQNKKRL